MRQPCTAATIAKGSARGIRMTRLRVRRGVESPLVAVTTGKTAVAPSMAGPMETVPRKEDGARTPTRGARAQEAARHSGESRGGGGRSSKTAAGRDGANKERWRESAASPDSVGDAGKRRRSEDAAGTGDAAH